MLIDKEKFDKIEKFMRGSGRLAEFEAKSGEVQGRMMITLGDVPAGMDVEVPEGSCVFIGTFDFIDVQIGVIVDPKTRKVASGMWVVPQTETAEPPAKDLCRFFVESLMKCIDKDGKFGIPMYSFITENADMTIAPSE